MIVAVDGNIGAGKSTALAALAAHGFPVHAEPVDDWPELELFYADPAEWALPLSLRVLLSFARIRRRIADAGGVSVCERSPRTCHEVFTQLLYNDGTLTRAQWDLFREFAAEIGWTPDGIVYVDTPVATCLARVATRGRRGETVDEPYLRRVEFQYETMMRYAGVPIERVDGSKPPAEVAADVLRAVERLRTTRVADAV